MTEPQRLDANQIIDLLTVAASYDQRTVGHDDIKAWTAAAVHARWDFQLSLTAIVDHYANRTERIMPGHITAWIRAKRQDAALRQPIDRPALPGRGDGADAVIRLWRQAIADSKRECQERRARVLAHPDLAARLKEPPMSLTEPAHWNGYIPPRALVEETCLSCEGAHSRQTCRNWPHRARVNDSPVRRQLVAITTEALAHEGATP